MNEIDFLNWVRGTGFQIASIIFIGGIIIRLFENQLLGRKANLAEPKGSEMQSGLRTIVTRSFPHTDTLKRSSFTIISGYIFHIGLFLIIFLYTPHILLIKNIIGFDWPALPSLFVDAVTVITIITLLTVLAHRLNNPVKRFLTTREDLLVWFVTIIPLITGYIAFHRIGMSAPSLLSLHILSVEILMIVFPFTQLMHSITIIMSRWYNGAISGYRGVES